MPPEDLQIDSSNGPSSNMRWILMGAFGTLCFLASLATGD